MKRAFAQVEEIKIGRRHRGSVGDLTPLVESIGRVGLLQPIGVNSRMELVFGERRLAACKRLGWESIPVLVVERLNDAALALIAERDENTCRLPMAMTELVSLGKELEKIEAEAAAERKAATQAKPGEQVGEPLGGGKLPPPENKGKTRDKVGAAIGVSGSTYEKAKQVVEAAEDDPEQFGDLPQKMDAESVHAAHQELKARTRPADEPELFAGEIRDGEDEPVNQGDSDPVGHSEHKPTSHFAFMPKGMPPPPRPEYEGELDKVMKLLTTTATAVTRFIRSDEKAAELFVHYCTTELKNGWVQYDWRKGQELDAESGDYVPLGGSGPVFAGLRMLRRLLHVSHKYRKLPPKKLREKLFRPGETLPSLDIPEA